MSGSLAQQRACGGIARSEEPRADLGGGVALKHGDAGEHLQHDHAKAVHVAGARHAPVVQHLHRLIGDRACRFTHCSQMPAPQ